MARARLGTSPGFTVLELLFVVGLTGTLAAIAVPYSLRALDDFHTRSAARYLAQRIGTARFDAIRRSVSSRGMPGRSSSGPKRCSER